MIEIDRYLKDSRITMNSDELDECFETFKSMKPGDLYLQIITMHQDYFRYFLLRDPSLTRSLVYASTSSSNTFSFSRKDALYILWIKASSIKPYGFPSFWCDYINTHLQSVSDNSDFIDIEEFIKMENEDENLHIGDE